MLKVPSKRKTASPSIRGHESSSSEEDPIPNRGGRQGKPRRSQRKVQKTNYYEKSLDPIPDIDIIRSDIAAHKESRLEMKNSSTPVALDDGPKATTTSASQKTTGRNPTDQSDAANGTVAGRHEANKARAATPKSTINKQASSALKDWVPQNKAQSNAAQAHQAQGQLADLDGISALIAKFYQMAGNAQATLSDAHLDRQCRAIMGNQANGGNDLLSDTNFKRWALALRFCRADQMLPPFVRLRSALDDNGGDSATPSQSKSSDPRVMSAAGGSVHSQNDFAEYPKQTAPMASMSVLDREDQSNQVTSGGGQPKHGISANLDSAVRGGNQATKARDVPVARNVQQQMGASNLPILHPGMKPAAGSGHANAKVNGLRAPAPAQGIQVAQSIQVASENQAPNRSFASGLGGRSQEGSAGVHGVNGAPNKGTRTGQPSQAPTQVIDLTSAAQHHHTGQRAQIPGATPWDPDQYSGMHQQAYLPTPPWLTELPTVGQNQGIFTDHRAETARLSGAIAKISRDLGSMLVTDKQDKQGLKANINKLGADAARHSKLTEMLVRENHALRESNTRLTDSVSRLRNSHWVLEDRVRALERGAEVGGPRGQVLLPGGSPGPIPAAKPGPAKT